MIYWKLFIAKWRLIGVAILLSVIGLQRIHSLKDALEIEGLKNRYQLESAVRESQVQALKSKSDSTLKEVNREHAKLVAAAEKNAFANFKRKYADANRDTLGSGIRSDNSIGMRLPTSPDSVPADSAKSTNGATEGIMAFDGGLLASFTRDCALDAIAVSQWQKWATSNNFPIEK